MTWEQASTSSTPAGTTLAFQPHVGVDQVPVSVLAPRSPVRKGGGSPRSCEDIVHLLKAGKTKEVKKILRETYWPVGNSIRTQLWPELCSQHRTSSHKIDGLYWENVKQIYGTTDLNEAESSLPVCIDHQYLLSFYLNVQGKIIANRVVSVIAYTHPYITYSPLLYPLVCILLHYMPEEQCYESMVVLLNQKQNQKHSSFISQTKCHFESASSTAMHLTSEKAKSAHNFVCRGLSHGETKQFYNAWIWWIFQELPFDYLIHVMDCFLHEGFKVLFRIEIALVVLYYKRMSRSDCVSKEMEGRSVDEAFARYCREMPISSDKLLKTAFAIRGLRWEHIHKLFVAKEMEWKSHSSSSGSRQLMRSLSSENLPTSQSQKKVQMISHTLTIRQGARTPDPIHKSLCVYPIEHLQSGALNKDSLLTLWSWLPVRITMNQPLLLYTTEEHGCSLTTFYGRVEKYEQTILIVKTLNDEVFGAYCSEAWARRNEKDHQGNRQTYFGTGETFVFTVSPVRQKFSWVGLNPNRADSRQGVQHSAELFMAGDAHMLTIGGGKGQAIWLDENLRYGKTDRCETFNNTPLCNTPDFEVKVVEVYGFESS